MSESACDTEAAAIEIKNMFGDLTIKAQIDKWGKTIMVDVLKENPKTAHVCYGGVRMKIHKVKNNFIRLSEEGAQRIVAEAMKFAQEARASAKEKTA